MAWTIQLQFAEARSYASIIERISYALMLPLSKELNEINVVGFLLNVCSRKKKERNFLIYEKRNQFNTKSCTATMNKMCERITQMMFSSKKNEVKQQILKSPSGANHNLKLWI